MSKNTPFIGSKISLISKAEIRYEGTLYQVDADNSTVTLAKVRSFGTEGRHSQKQILPRSEVYEFIIFRGNDIKDLNVSEMPGQQNESPISPQDPAILSAHSSAPSALLPPGPVMSQPPGPPAHPPPLHTMPPTGGLPSQPPPPYYAHPPPHGYSAFGMPYFRPPMMMGTGAARHPQPPTIPPMSAYPQHTPRPPPPQAPTVTSSTQGHLVAVVTPQGGTLVDSSPDLAITSSDTAFSTALLDTPSVVVPASLESKPQASSTPLVAASESDSPLQPLTVSATAAEAVLPLDHEPPIDSTHSVSRPHAAALHHRQQQQQQQHQYQQASSDSHVPSAFQTAQHLPSLRDNEEQEKRRGSGQEGVDSGRKKTGRSRDQPPREGGGQVNHRGNSNTAYQGYSRGRRDNQYYRGGRGGGWRNDGRQNQERPTDRSSSFKYDSEFDFESANARFKKEDLEVEFKLKLRLDDRSRKVSEESGRKASEGSGRKASEGSGYDLNESSGEEAEVIEDGGSASDEVEEYYDKTKSFFDTISCENNSASARRPTRIEEREVNTETFGVSSVNSNYGYYRYRRNWRGRSRGGDYRGRGGEYRGRGGDYRGRGGEYRGRGGEYRGRGGEYRGGGRGRYRNEDGRYRNEDGRYRNEEGRYRNEEGRYRGDGGRGGRGRGGRGGDRGRGGGRGSGSHRNNNYESFSPTPL